MAPSAWASDFLYVAHLVWLAVGTSRLARRLGADGSGAAVAGVAAALSGFAASAVMNGIPLFALAWMPWILDAVDRRATLALIALWAAQLLAGVPGTVDTVVVAALWTLARGERRLPSLAWLAAHVRGGAAAGGGGAVAGARARRRQRALGGAVVRRRDRVVAASVAARRARLAAPVRRRAARRERRHAPRADVGLQRVPRRAGAAAGGRARSARERRARWIAAIAAFMLVVALGRYTPLYALYRAVVVPERLVRYPEKHVGAVVVLLAVLAGVGCTHAFASPRARRLAVVLGVLRARLRRRARVRRGAGVRGRRRGARRAAPVAGDRGDRGAPRRRRLGRAAARAARGADARAAAAGADRRRRDAAPARLSSRRASSRSRTPRPAPSSPSPSATPACRTRARRSASRTSPASTPRSIRAGTPSGTPARATAPTLLSRFDVRWVILPSVARARRSSRAPRSAASCSPRTRSAARAPSSPRASTRSTTPRSRRARSRRRAPRPSIWRATAPAAGYAVLLDSFAAGWSATVDGAPAPIVRADEVARAVAIPAGAHTIAFRYRTPGLRAGALVSLAAWLAWLAALAVTRLRSRARAPRASAARR